MKIEVRRSPSIPSEWYVRIVARNGKILMHSENFNSLTGAMHNAGVVVEGISSARIVVFHEFGKEK